MSASEDASKKKLRERRSPSIGLLGQQISQAIHSFEDEKPPSRNEKPSAEATTAAVPTRTQETIDKLKQQLDDLS